MDSNDFVTHGTIHPRAYIAQATRNIVVLTEEVVVNSLVTHGNRFQRDLKYALQFHTNKNENITCC